MTSRIVLTLHSLIHQISPNGLSESQVQVLGPVSRVATTEEIKKWNITKSDTLAALMTSSDGDWNSSQVQIFILLTIASIIFVCNYRIHGSLGGANETFVVHRTLSFRPEKSSQSTSALTII